MSIKVNSDIAKASVAELQPDQFVTAKQVLAYTNSATTLQYLFTVTTGKLSVTTASATSTDVTFPYSLPSTNYLVVTTVSDGTDASGMTALGKVTKFVNKVNLTLVNACYNAGTKTGYVQADIFMPVQIGANPTVWANTIVQNKKTGETFGGKAIWKARVYENSSSDINGKSYVFETDAIDKILSVDGAVCESTEWFTTYWSNTPSTLRVVANTSTKSLYGTLAGSWHVKGQCFNVEYTLVTERAEPSDPKELLRLTEENNE